MTDERKSVKDAIAACRDAGRSYAGHVLDLLRNDVITTAEAREALGLPPERELYPTDDSPGAKVLSGRGEPLKHTGGEGDFYIDTSTGRAWRNDGFRWKDIKDISNQPDMRAGEEMSGETFTVNIMLCAGTTPEDVGVMAADMFRQRLESRRAKP